MSEDNPIRFAIITLASAFVIYVVGFAFTIQSILMGVFSEGVGADRERIYWALGRAGAIAAGVLLVIGVSESLAVTPRSTKTLWPLLLSLPALLVLILFDYVGLGFR
jgi:hypothetical protein